jgi:hypothetical protein
MVSAGSGAALISVIFWHHSFHDAKNEMKSARVPCLVVPLLIIACAPSSHILIGTPRPAISPADVRVFTTPPPQAEQIALLDAHSDSVFGPGGQKAIDKVIDRLKTQAAQLGANGIVLGDVSDRQTGSIGTGVGSGSYSGNSAVGVGVGGSLGIYKKSGKATAIYVPPSGSGSDGVQK